MRAVEKRLETAMNLLQTSERQRDEARAEVEGIEKERDAAREAESQARSERDNERYLTKDGDAWRAPISSHLTSPVVT